MKRTVGTCVWTGIVVSLAFRAHLAHAHQDDAPSAQVAPVAGVRLHQGRIDVDVRDVTLGEVFREIERQGVVRFVAAESTIDRVVSDKFHDLSIVKGIQRLLIGQDYVIELAPGRAFEGTASMIVRVVGESSGASRVAQRATTPDDDPGEAARRRAQQLTELAADADAATIAAALEQAIRDPHATVRETALEVVEMMEEEEAPAQLVAEVALTDDNPDLRLAALDLLDVLSDVHREVVLRTLRQAADDQNNSVKKLARDLIDALETER